MPGCCLSCCGWKIMANFDLLCSLPQNIKDAAVQGQSRGCNFKYFLCNISECFEFRICLNYRGLWVNRKRAIRILPELEISLRIIITRRWAQRTTIIDIKISISSIFWWRFDAIVVMRRWKRFPIINFEFE
jgi:hypothetical protein